MKPVQDLILLFQDADGEQKQLSLSFKLQRVVRVSVSVSVCVCVCVCMCVCLCKKWMEKGGCFRTNFSPFQRKFTTQIL